MRRTKLVALATASLISAAVTLPLSSAGAAPGTGAGSAPSTSGPATHSDSLTPKWRSKFEERNQKAVEKRLRHGGRGNSVKVGKGAYGRVAQTGQDKIFVVLAEFGNTQHSAYAGQAPDAQRVDGPMHNQIPEPDRSKDNSTNWQPDYDQAHYQNMYFKRMKKFYEDQSSGKYSVDGQVTEWVKVPFNEARYGRDSCGDIVCTNTWFLIRDALAEWTQSKIDAGWSMAKIQAYLKTFDHQDRYDFDGDGDFNEPDGYIDHFQIVHAGGDQADGDPVYGSDAIWSHRWNAQIEPFGTGPEGGAPIGGVNVGEGGLSDPNGSKVEIPDNPTGVWVNDYTIQPENGGLSVFAHEFGHDLGLPGPLRHLRQHRWRLQHRRALVADEPVPRHRQERPGHRRPAHAVRCLGEVPARLAGLRHRSPRPRRDVPDPSGPVDVGRTRPTPWSSCCRTSTCRSTSARPAPTAARATSTATRATTSTPR